MSSVAPLPRPVDLRGDDSDVSVRRQMEDHARDVRAFLRDTPRVVYVEAQTTTSGVPVRATPKAVSVARVISGTVSAAPFVDWEPSTSGVTIRAVYGVSAGAILLLRIEV